MLLHSSSRRRLLNEDEKPVFLTSRNLKLTTSDDSLEKQLSTTEKLRRDLLKMKQSSVNTDDNAPSPSRVLEVLLFALRCVEKKDEADDDDESLIDDFDDELRDSIHLAKRRIRPRDSDASWPATKLQGDSGSCSNAVDDSCAIPNLEPDSRSTLRAKDASMST